MPSTHPWPPPSRDTNPKAERAVADGKIRVGLVEPHVRQDIAVVLEHGADKYGTRNWRVHPIYIRTYVDAIQRHLDAWAEGEDFDPDSGEHPLAHIGANVVVILDALKHATLVDDRDFAEAKPAGHAANQPGGEKTARLAQIVHEDAAILARLGDDEPTRAVGEVVDWETLPDEQPPYPGPCFVDCMGEPPTAEDIADAAAHNAVPINTGEEGAFTAKLHPRHAVMATRAPRREETISETERRVLDRSLLRYRARNATGHGSDGENQYVLDPDSADRPLGRGF